MAGSDEMYASWWGEVNLPYAFPGQIRAISQIDSWTIYCACVNLRHLSFTSSNKFLIHWSVRSRGERRLVNRSLSISLFCPAYCPDEFWSSIPVRFSSRMEFKEWICRCNCSDIINHKNFWSRWWNNRRNFLDILFQRQHKFISSESIQDYKSIRD